MSKTIEFFFNKRTAALSLSGTLILWSLFGANLTETAFTSELGIEDQQVLAWILVAAILYFTTESLAGLTLTTEYSRPSTYFVATLVVVSPTSIFLSFPSLVADTILAPIGRLDLAISVAAAFFSALATAHAKWSIESTVIFYKHRKKLDRSFVSHGIAAALLLLLFIGFPLWRLQANPIELLFAIGIFVAFYILFLLTVTHRGPSYSEDDLSFIANKNEQLNRQKEISQAWHSLGMDASVPVKKPARAAKSLQRRMSKKANSISSNVETLHELSVDTDGPQLEIDGLGAENDTPIVRITAKSNHTGQEVSRRELSLDQLKQSATLIDPKTLPNLDMQTVMDALILHTTDSADLNQMSDPQTLFFNLATYDESLPSAKNILNSEDNIDINFVRADGWTALMHAAAENQSEAVLYLLQKAANPNVQNKFGVSPLMFASRYGYSHIAKHLIKYNADPNLYDSNQGSPLIEASRFGHYQLVTLLLEAGADIGHIDDKGKAAVDYAADNNYGDIIRSLTAGS